MKQLFRDIWAMLRQGVGFCARTINSADLAMQMVENEVTLALREQQLEGNAKLRDLEQQLGIEVQ